MKTAQQNDISNVIPAGCAPFDLAKALAGEKLVTRSNRQVRNFQKRPTSDPFFGFSYSAEIREIDGWRWRTFTEKGTWAAEPIISDDDLFLAAKEGETVRPTVVCLCGSSKFPEHHMRVMMDETLAGRIVIPMGLYGHADFPAGARAATNDGDESTRVKQMLDTLHKRKIDGADEILVVTVGGYFGNSTKGEIEYAKASGKGVRFQDFPASPPPETEARCEEESACAKCSQPASMRLKWVTGSIDPYCEACYRDFEEVAREVDAYEDQIEASSGHHYGHVPRPEILPLEEASAAPQTEIDRQIEVMRASKTPGAMVEVCRHGSNHWETVPQAFYFATPTPFNWSEYDYRIRPASPAMPRRVWVNIYADGAMGHAHKSKKLAECAKHKAQKPVIVEFIELTPEVRAKLGIGGDGV